MASIQQIKLGSTYYPIAFPFITCATPAATAEKDISGLVSGLTLSTGADITLKFSNGNSNASPTLKINSTSTDTKSIIGDGACKPASFSTANCLMHLVYDGSNWQIIG